MANDAGHARRGKAAARTERSRRSSAGTGRRSGARSGATAAAADTGTGRRRERPRRGASRPSSVAGKMTPERWRTAEDRLAEGWSPDRTAGRFRKEGIPMAGRERTCRHVRADRKAGAAALPFPAPAGQEAGPEGRAPFGPGPHPGPRGHLRAPGDRGGEGAGRRLGGGHDRRQGPQRRPG